MMPRLPPCYYQADEETFWSCFGTSPGSVGLLATHDRRDCISSWPSSHIDGRLTSKAR